MFESLLSPSKDGFTAFWNWLQNGDNNTDDNTKKINHHLSEIDNVENSSIKFADKKDQKEIENKLDTLSNHNLEISLNDIDRLKLKYL